MEQKEIITALHAQLKEAAQRIFANLDIQPGNYSAGDVEKEMQFIEAFRIYNTTDTRKLMEEYTKALEAFQAVDDDGHREAAESLQRAKNRRSFDSVTLELADEYNIKRYKFDEWSGKYNTYTEAAKKVEPLAEMITISCNGFTASMPGAMVFAKLADWEKEFKISTKDRAKFVKEEEGEVIFSCVVVFPKSAKNTALYVGKDQARPMLSGVCLNPEGGYITASDTHVLNKTLASVTEIQGQPKNIIIDAKVIKAVAGQACTVTLSLLETSQEQITITTKKGDVYTCENIKGIFPSVERVIPKVNKDGLFKIAKKDIKAVTAFAKGVAKTKLYRPLIIVEIPAGSLEGTMKFYNPETESTKECKFYLTYAPDVNVSFGIDANKLVILCNGWDGSIWYLAKHRPFVFGTDSDIVNLGMPMQAIDTNLTAGEVNGVVPADDRANYDLALARLNAKEVAKEVATTISKEEKEEPQITDFSELITLICEIAECVKTLGYLLEICRKGCEIEELANNIGIEPTKEETTEPREDVRSIPKDPPGPPKAICEISGPPGFKFIIKPTINKNLIIQNHDRNNNLAPPHCNNRVLRLPRLPVGSGCNLWNLCLLYLHIVGVCQVGRQESRGSPRRSRGDTPRKRESNQGMGKEVGKKASDT